MDFLEVSNGKLCILFMHIIYLGISFLHVIKNIPEIYSDM